MERSEAIEIVREYYPSSGKDLNEALETLVPELKESEDERIKKELIGFIQDEIDSINCRVLRDNDDIARQKWCKKALAWLEKQDDKAFSVERVFAEAGIKPAYKDGNSWCVLIGENTQEGICGFGETPKDAYIAFLKKLWGKAFEQNPADKVEPKFRVGDTIRPKGSSAKIFKITGISISDGYYKGEGSYLDIIAADDGYELVEQNHAWSKEDEKMLNKCIEYASNIVPVKATEESGLFVDFKRIPDEKVQDWLKSLKERYTWKPSDEQMEYLAKAITTLGNEGDNKTSAILCELRTDLKKLKG